LLKLASSVFILIGVALHQDAQFFGRC